MTRFDRRMHFGIYFMHSWQLTSHIVAGGFYWRRRNKVFPSKWPFCNKRVLICNFSVQLNSSGGIRMSNRAGFHRTCIGISFCLLIWALQALAQTSSATLTGTVRDSSGAVLPGVTITATNTLRNTSHSTISNEAGNYVIPALNPGTYSVTAELTGFKKFLQEGIVLQVNQVARIDITLDVGNMSE